MFHDNFSTTAPELFSSRTIIIDFLVGLFLMRVKHDSRLQNYHADGVAITEVYSYTAVRSIKENSAKKVNKHEKSTEISLLFKACLF